MKSIDFSYSQNREISWLRFNKRVLQQAEDANVPIGERLKFVSIFDQNLDEFFMVRVGGLVDLSLIKQVPDNKSNLTAKEQLSLIYQEVSDIYPSRETTLTKLRHHLKEYDVIEYTVNQLDKHKKTMLDKFVEQEVIPIVSPQIIDPQHPFPHLESACSYLFVRLVESKKMYYGIVSIPSKLPSLFVFDEEGVHYITMEEILVGYAKIFFKQFKVLEKALIKVTRNTDLDFKKESIVEEDYNYRSEMKKILKKRERLVPVRLEIKESLTYESIHYLIDRLGLKHYQVFYSKSPLQMGYVFSLIDVMKKKGLKDLFYVPYQPYVYKPTSMMKTIEDESMLLHYPYQSFAPFLQLLQEAAMNPNVISIKMTIYRVAKLSKIIEYLCLAAENKKEVIVFVELRARFDEENNIHWAEILEEAGCVLMYGIDKYKIHSKLLLITYRDKQRIRYISHVGTGNFNEQTVKLYTDLSYLSASTEIGVEMAELFNQLLLNQLKGHFKRLIVAPKQLKNQLLELILQQMQLKKDGYVRIKCNALTDRELIDALANASMEGVKVDLVIRGICCLLPGVKGKTENIRVISIVGRFLEHSRIYQFGRNEEAKIYIASADLMTRNTEKRVEVGIDINEVRLKQRVLDYLDLCFEDSIKAMVLNDGGFYEHIHSNNGIDSQQILLEQAMNIQYPTKQRTLKDRIKALLGFR